MTSLRGLLVASLVLLAVAPAARGADAEVLEAVSRFGDAYRDADVEFLSGMLVDDYVHTNSSSPPIGRDGWLEWVASRRDLIEQGSLRIVEYENSDLMVVTRGEMAIVTGMNRTVSENDGVRKESVLRFTQVWVRSEGVWKRAAFQDCRSD